MATFIKSDPWIIDLEKISAIKVEEDAVSIYIDGIGERNPIIFKGEQKRAFVEHMAKATTPSDWTGAGRKKAESSEK